MEGAADKWDVSSKTPLKLRHRGRVWSARAVTGYAVVGMAILMPLILGAVDDADASLG